MIYSGRNSSSFNRKVAILLVVCMVICSNGIQTLASSDFLIENIPNKSNTLYNDSFDEDNYQNNEDALSDLERVDDDVLSGSDSFNELQQDDNEDNENNISFDDLGNNDENDSEDNENNEDDENNESNESNEDDSVYENDILHNENYAESDQYADDFISPSDTDSINKESEYDEEPEQDDSSKMDKNDTNTITDQGFADDNKNESKSGNANINNDINNGLSLEQQNIDDSVRTINRFVCSSCLSENIEFYDDTLNILHCLDCGHYFQRVHGENEQSLGEQINGKLTDYFENNIEDLIDKENEKQYAKVHFVTEFGSLENDEVKVLKNEKVECPTIEAEGRTLVCWLCDDEEWDFDNEVVEDITLTAKWETNTYTINYNFMFDDNKNATTSFIKTYGVVYDDLLTVEREGYEFIGWYVEDTFETLYEGQDLSNINNDSLTIYAKWKENKYSISYIIDKATIINNDKFVTERLYGEEQELPNKEDILLDGYILDGWKDIETEKVVEKIEKNTALSYSLQPIWKPIIYNIIFDTKGGKISTPSFVKTYGQNIENIIEPTKFGYVFLGWYKDEDFNEIYSGEDLTNVNDDDQTIYARWAFGNKEDYIITLIYETNGGEISSPSYTKKYGINAELLEPTKVGFTFQGWYLDEELTNIYDGQEIYDTEDGTKTIYAKWDYKLYDISYDLMDGKFKDGFVATTSKTYFEELTLPTADDCKKDNYYFAGWKDLDNGNIITILPENVDKSYNLQAVWKYIMRFDLNGGHFEEKELEDINVEVNNIKNQIDINDEVNNTKNQIDINAIFEDKNNDIDEFTQENKRAVENDIKNDIKNDSENELNIDINDSNINEDAVNGGIINIFGEDNNTNVDDFPPQTSSNSTPFVKTYGDSNIGLPIPNRPGYIFVGWFIKEFVVDDDVHEFQTADGYILVDWYPLMLRGPKSSEENPAYPYGYTPYYGQDLPPQSTVEAQWFDITNMLICTFSDGVTATCSCLNNDSYVLGVDEYHLFLKEDIVLNRPLRDTLEEDMYICLNGKNLTYKSNEPFVKDLNGHKIIIANNIYGEQFDYLYVYDDPYQENTLDYYMIYRKIATASKIILDYENNNDNYFLKANNNEIRLEDVIIETNKPISGLVDVSDSAKLYITNVDIHNIDNNNHPMINFSGSEFIVDNVRFRDCILDNNSLISIDGKNIDDVNIKFSNTVITGNIFTDNSLINIENSNKVSFEKEFIYASNSIATESINKDSNNIYVKNSTIKSTGDFFGINNKSRNGGVFTLDNSTLINKSTMSFIENLVGDNGGGIYAINNSVINLTDENSFTLFWRNDSNDHGACISLDHSSLDGQNIYAKYNDSIHGGFVSEKNNSNVKIFNENSIISNYNAIYLNKSTFDTDAIDETKMLFKNNIGHYLFYISDKDNSVTDSSKIYLKNTTLTQNNPIKLFSQYTTGQKVLFGGNVVIPRDEYQDGITLGDSDIDIYEVGDVGLTSRASISFITINETETNIIYNINETEICYINVFALSDNLEVEYDSDLKVYYLKDKEDIIVRFYDTLSNISYGDYTVKYDESYPLLPPREQEIESIKIDGSLTFIGWLDDRDVDYNALYTLGSILKISDIMKEDISLSESYYYQVTSDKFSNMFQLSLSELKNYIKQYISEDTETVEVNTYALFTLYGEEKTKKLIKPYDYDDKWGNDAYDKYKKFINGAATVSELRKVNLTLQELVDCIELDIVDDRDSSLLGKKIVDGIKHMHEPLAIISSGKHNIDYYAMWVRNEFVDSRLFIEYLLPSSSKEQYESIRTVYFYSGTPVKMLNPELDMPDVWKKFNYGDKHFIGWSEVLFPVTRFYGHQLVQAYDSLCLIPILSKEYKSPEECYVTDLDVGASVVIKKSAATRAKEFFYCFVSMSVQVAYIVLSTVTAPYLGAYNGLLWQGMNLALSEVVKAIGKTSYEGSLFAKSYNNMWGITDLLCTVAGTGFTIYDKVANLAPLSTAQYSVKFAKSAFGDGLFFGWSGFEKGKTSKETVQNVFSTIFGGLFLRTDNNFINPSKNIDWRDYYLGRNIVNNGSTLNFRLFAQIARRWIQNNIGKDSETDLNADLSRYATMNPANYDKKDLYAAYNKTLSGYDSFDSLYHSGIGIDDNERVNAEYGVYTNDGYFHSLYKFTGYGDDVVTSTTSEGIEASKYYGFDLTNNKEDLPEYIKRVAVNPTVWLIDNVMFGCKLSAIMGVVDMIDYADDTLGSSSDDEVKKKNAIYYLNRLGYDEKHIFNQNLNEGGDGAFVTLGYKMGNKDQLSEAITDIKVFEINEDDDIYDYIDISTIENSKDGYSSYSNEYLKKLNKHIKNGTVVKDNAKYLHINFDKETESSYLTADENFDGKLGFNGYKAKLKDDPDWTIILQNLNTGSSKTSKQLYLGYKKDSNQLPINKLYVSQLLDAYRIAGAASEFFVMALDLKNVDEDVKKYGMSHLANTNLGKKVDIGRSYMSFVHDYADAKQVSIKYLSGMKYNTPRHKVSFIDNHTGKIEYIDNFEVLTAEPEEAMIDGVRAFKVGTEYRFPSAPASAPSNYIFQGWSLSTGSITIEKDEDGKEYELYHFPSRVDFLPGDTMRVYDCAMTYYAVYKNLYEKSMAVFLDSEDETKVYGGVETHIGEPYLLLDFPKKDGYEFRGWSTYKAWNDTTNLYNANERVICDGHIVATSAVVYHPEFKDYSVSDKYYAMWAPSINVLSNVKIIVGPDGYNQINKEWTSENREAIKDIIFIKRDGKNYKGQSQLLLGDNIIYKKVEVVEDKYAYDLDDIYEDYSSDIYYDKSGVSDYDVYYTKDRRAGNPITEFVMYVESPNYKEDTKNFVNLKWYGNNTRVKFSNYTCASIIRINFDVLYTVRFEKGDSPSTTTGEMKSITQYEGMITKINNLYKRDGYLLDYFYSQNDGSKIYNFVNTLRDSEHCFYINHDDTLVAKWVKIGYMRYRPGLVPGQNIVGAFLDDDVRADGTTENAIRTSSHFTVSGEHTHNWVFKGWKIVPTSNVNKELGYYNGIDNQYEYNDDRGKKQIVKGNKIVLPFKGYNDLTFIEYWQERFHVKYNMNYPSGARISGYQVQDEWINKGKELELTRMPSSVEGYDFKGWSKKHKIIKSEAYHYDRSSRNKVSDGFIEYYEVDCPFGSKISIVEDINLIAVWRKKVKITYFGNGQSSGNMDSHYCYAGDKVKIHKNSFTKDSREFKDWKGDYFYCKEYDEIVLKNDLSLTAVWTGNFIIDLAIVNNGKESLCDKLTSYLYSDYGYSTRTGDVAKNTWGNYVYIVSRHRTMEEEVARGIAITDIYFDLQNNGGSSYGIEPGSYVANQYFGVPGFYFTDGNNTKCQFGDVADLFSGVCKEYCYMYYKRDTAGKGLTKIQSYDAYHSYIKRAHENEKMADGTGGYINGMRALRFNHVGYKKETKKCVGYHYGYKYKIIKKIFDFFHINYENTVIDDFEYIYDYEITYSDYYSYDMYHGGGGIDVYIKKRGKYASYDFVSMFILVD